MEVGHFFYSVAFPSFLSLSLFSHLLFIYISFLCLFFSRLLLACGYIMIKKNRGIKKTDELNVMICFKRIYWILCGLRGWEFLMNEISVVVYEELDGIFRETDEGWGYFDMVRVGLDDVYEAYFYRTLEKWMGLGWIWAWVMRSGRLRTALCIYIFRLKSEGILALSLAFCLVF